MSDEAIIKFCIRHGITADQFFFMWLITRKDFTLPLKYSYAKQYLKHCGKFKEELVQNLVERGLIDDFNTEGKSLPEMFLVRDHILKEFYVDEAAGEELYNSYPATFPLAGGGSFIARAGGDKEDLIATYLKRIRNNPDKHKFVMGQLSRYIDLVKAGKINGHKISDWITQELWDTVANIKEKGTTTFGRDI